MKSVQEIFDRLQDKKKQVKVVRQKYKQELASSTEHQRITEELEKLRAKKKKYELSIREQAGAIGGPSTGQVDERCVRHHGFGRKIGFARSGLPPTDQRVQHRRTAGAGLAQPLVPVMRCGRRGRRECQLQPQLV